MDIISVENSNRLLWLGRYSERVYTTVHLFADSYDVMLDLKMDDYSDFCRKLDIPDIYTSKEDFCERYCFDSEDPNSIYSNMMRAYDNAIQLREEIGSETMCYMQLAVYALNRAKISKAPLIELQKVEDNILAFWGIVDDIIEDENVRNIIKVGKRIERLDIYGRLNMDKKSMAREVHRLTGRIARTCLHYKEDYIKNLNSFVENDRIDYNRVVKEVENLLED